MVSKNTEFLDKSSINIDILLVFFGPLGNPTKNKAYVSGQLEVSVCRYYI